MVEVNTLCKAGILHPFPSRFDLRNKAGWDGMGEMGKFPREIFLLGGGNLRRSNFDHSNIFQN